MAYQLLIYPDPLDSRCTLTHDGVPGPLVATPALDPVSGRAGQAFELPATTPDGWGAELRVEKEGYVPFVGKGIAWLADDATVALEMDDFRLTPMPTAPEPPEPPVEPGEPGTIPGCLDNRLKDPEAYFFSVIGRKKGDRADDFADVLRNTFPAGPNPHEHADPRVHYAITQQIGAGGRIAGRLWLPAQTPDALGYYTLIVHILADVGGPNGVDGLKWAWTPEPDSRQYDAAPCW